MLRPAEKSFLKKNVCLYHRTQRGKLWTDHRPHLENPNTIDVDKNDFTDMVLERRHPCKKMRSEKWAQGWKERKDEGIWCRTWDLDWKILVRLGQVWVCLFFYCKRNSLKRGRECVLSWGGLVMKILMFWFSVTESKTKLKCVGLKQKLFYFVS